jgi:hypothetical protein
MNFYMGFKQKVGNIYVFLSDHNTVDLLLAYVVAWVRFSLFIRRYKCRTRISHVSLGDRVQSVPTSRHVLDYVVSPVERGYDPNPLWAYGTKLFNRLLVRLQSVVGSRERVIAYRQIERVVFE